MQSDDNNNNNNNNNKYCRTFALNSVTLWSSSSALISCVFRRQWGKWKLTRFNLLTLLWLHILKFPTLPLSAISRVLASCSFVTVQSDRTAVTAHLCSKGLLNMSEFHLVLHDWISWCFRSFICSCLSSSALHAGVLWLKCRTGRPAAMITQCTNTLNPSFTVSCSAWAKQGIVSQFSAPG